MFYAEHIRAFMFFLFVLSVLFTPATPVRAETDEGCAAFLQANAAYNQTNFSRAIRLYKKAEALRFTPGGLYYNLGNAYYRDGRLGNAIASYLRARRLLPRDSDVVENLKTARDQTEDGIATREPAAALRQFLFVYYKFSVDELMWTSAVFVALLFIGLAVYAFAPWPALRRLLTIVAVITVVAGSAAGCRLYEARAGRHAVVVADTAVVRAGPNDTFAEMFILHDGTEIKVLEKDTQWAKIQVAKKKGWIERRTIDTI